MEVKVKLYGLLRLKYKTYNNTGCIIISLNGNPTLKNLVNILNIKLQDIGIIMINGKIIKDTQMIIKNGDVINFFSHLPQGG